MFLKFKKFPDVLPLLRLHSSLVCPVYPHLSHVFVFLCWWLLVRFGGGPLICESVRLRCGCLLLLGCRLLLPILLMVSLRFEPDRSDSICLVCRAALCRVWAMVISFSSIRSASMRRYFRNFDDLQVAITWIRIYSSVSLYSQYKQSCRNLVMYCSILSFAWWNFDLPNGMFFLTEKWL